MWLLVLSGEMAILWSSLLGGIMSNPLRPNGAKQGKGANYKQIGSTDLDRIMLGLIQGLAAGLILTFGLDPALCPVSLMIFSRLLNPLPDVFRAFGINPLVLADGPVHRMAAALGGISSLSIVVSCSVLLFDAAANWMP